jgi:imidazolonepropionase-like amidohydrolase
MWNTTRKLAGLIVAFAITATALQAQYTDKIFVKNAKIVPVVGKTIEKGHLLIEDGKIVGMGADMKAPFDARVIEADGMLVMPGYVEAMTSRGMDVANENVPVAPFLQVFDAIDPSDEYFEGALRNGYTTLHVSQGNNTVVAGVSRMLRPLGLSVEEMTVKPEGGLKISLSPRRGYDHAVQLAALRGAFDELDRYLDAEAERLYAEDRKKAGEEVLVTPAEARKLGRPMIKPSKLNDKYRNLYRLVQGKLDAYLWCQRAMDVDRAVAFAKKHGLDSNMTMVLGSESYKAAKSLEGLKRPVIVPVESFVHREIDRLTLEEKDTFLPGVLAERKVPFAVAGATEPWYAAARLVRNGIPRQQALEAVTIAAARAIGMDHRVGSLEKGKDGNLVILSGDPLDTTSWVEMVVIEGRLVYERSKDKRLRHLIQGIYDTKMIRKQAAEKKTKDAAGDKPAPSEAKKN